MVCFYCGHVSNSMMEAARHEAHRPESCLPWRRQTSKQVVTEPAEIESILQTLTVQGEGNLDQALDDHYERIERSYR